MSRATGGFAVAAVAVAASLAVQALLRGSGPAHASGPSPAPRLVIQSGAGGALPTAERAWADRLEALDPSRPEAYLVLAEEVADQGGPGATDLARRLFALAGTLDQRRLGRSACLAIADLSTDRIEARRCRAVAALLDDRGGVAAPRPNEGTDDAPTAVAVGEGLSFFRRGMGSQAMRRLERPPAPAILERHEWAFDGGVVAFLEEVKRLRAGQRPRLSDAELVDLLRLELGLLEGADRPWSADLAMTQGQPLTEADPTRLADLFGIDPSRSLFRDGRWTTAASGRD